MKPGNIYSGTNDSFLSVLTNPTELSFFKGNIKGHYPVKFNGVLYKDAEAAYQANSRSIKQDAKACYIICIEVITEKLRQHPKIKNAITAAGGRDFLKKCSHYVGQVKPIERCGRWEGQGPDSGFIRCLMTAYTLSLVKDA